MKATEHIACFLHPSTVFLDLVQHSDVPPFSRKHRGHTQMFFSVCAMFTFARGSVVEYR